MQALVGDGNRDVRGQTANQVIAAFTNGRASGTTASSTTPSVGPRPGRRSR